MAILIFWVLTPCRLADRYQSLGKKAASILSPEDGGRLFLRNVGTYLQAYTALQPIRTLTISVLSSIWTQMFSLGTLWNMYTSFASHVFTKQTNVARFHDITVVTMMTVYWDVAPCSLVKVTDVSEVLSVPSHLFHDSTHLWNVGKFLQIHTTQHPSRQSCSSI
jgi:hypothetical protein